MGFTVAISPLVAELKGAGKQEQCGNLLNNAMFLNFLVCLFLVILLFSCGSIIYYLKQDIEVARLGRPYLNWMLWSIVPMILFLSMKQFCDGLNHTLIPLILSLSSIPCNAVINYFLIYGHYGFPKLELIGAGIATFITRCLMAIILALYVYNYKPFKNYNIRTFKLHKDRIRKIAALAIPSAWQYGSEVGAFVVLGIIVGWFGAIQQAAHQVSLSVAAMTFMVSIGLSTAGSIKVGEAYGMQNIHLARKTGIAVLKFATAYGSFCALIFILLRNQIPHLFTSDPEVIIQASVLFLFAAAFQLGDSIQAVGIGILRGLQDVKLPTIYTTLSYWFIGIPVGYFLGVIVNWQIIGIWIGFIVCLSVMAILLCLRFLKITGNFKGNTL
jgi:MATE family multidrug resistance protein